MQTKYTALLFSATLLLQACAAAPLACPRLPAQPAKAQLGLSFQETTARLLAGKLPEQMDYALPSKPVNSGLKP